MAMETTFMNRTTAIAAALLLAVTILKGQDDNSNRHYPSILLGVGGIKFTGDVGKLTEINPLLDARVGYYLKAEYRFGKHFGLMLGGLYGKFAGTDNSRASHLNFQSTVMQGDLNFVTYWDHLFKKNDEVSPYLCAGVGYMLFDPYGDIKNGGNTYYYWTDGSVRDQAETQVNMATASVIKRDYVYETQLTDSLANYKRASLVIPIGTGFDWQLGKLHRWDVQVGINYNLILSDYVDNKKSGGNDSYVMGHVGLKYTFAPRIKTPYDTVDFNAVDKLDVDLDGVPDDVDKCLSTPKGVQVDKHGCPPDADHDGVADYMDRESNTKKGATVNEYGVALNIDSIAYHQVMWDSLAPERLESFYNNPSLSYMQSVQSTNPNAGKGDYSKIPNAIKPADINKDGFISVEEISKTIDGFFEGTNEFTVENINALIDYFFEQ
jgi:hypothetical protein